MAAARGATADPITGDQAPNPTEGLQQAQNPQPLQNPINPLPPGRQAQQVGATPFAAIYRSIFILRFPELLPRLAHLNCSYLSTPGLAPSLLQLKQHAQALIILIKQASLNTIPALIDGANSGIAGAPTFNDAETFDFLNDLSTPYMGPKNEAFMRHHTLPLTAHMNLTVTSPASVGNADGGQGQGQAACLAIDDICPLHTSHKTPINGPSLPFAQHQSLIEHANEVLELLDHEYSAKGGLLSILPPLEEKENRAKAETTLLGQMITHMQWLYERIHELERAYANALDVLAGEAAVPAQQLSRLGPDGRKGREVVYPQDRFVLANCGDDLWDWLNYEFEKKEKADDSVRLLYNRAGVTGEQMFKVRGQKQFERGITVLDVTTRYVRLRKDALKTVFIIPAHEHHPGTKATREMEKVPTVVNVVKPVWPPRASAWEMKNRAQLEELKQLKADYEVAKHETLVAKNAEQMMVESERHHRLAAAELKKKLKLYEDPDPNAVVNQLASERNDLQAKVQQLEAQKAAFEAEKAETERKKRELEAREQRLDKERHEFIAARQKDDADKFAQNEARLRAIADLEAKAALEAAELQEKLKSAWKKQIIETGEVLAVLQLRKENLDDRIVGEKAARAKGAQDGTAEFDKAVAEFIAKKRGERRLGTDDDEQRGFDDGEGNGDVDMYD